MPDFATIDALNPKGRRVLVRVDLNVPMKDGRVTDMTRIDRAAVTLRELADRGARVVVLSHFGRPKGKDPAFSLQQLVQPLAGVLGRSVRFASDCVGPEAEAVVNALKDGDVALHAPPRGRGGAGESPGAGHGGPAPGPSGTPAVKLSPAWPTQ